MALKTIRKSINTRAHVDGANAHRKENDSMPVTPEKEQFAQREFIPTTSEVLSVARENKGNQRTVYGRLK